MSTLELQLDASQLGASDRSALTTWPDVSGHSPARDATQAIAHFRPTFRRNGPSSGKPCVDFKDHDSYFQTAAIATIAQPITIFVVMSGFDGTGVQGIFDGITGHTKIAMNTSGVAIPPGQLLAIDGGSVIVNSPPALPRDLPTAIFTAHFEGAGSRARWNGMSFLTGNAGALGFEGLSLALALATGDTLKAEVHEVRIYSGLASPTEADLHLIERELAQKWRTTFVFKDSGAGDAVTVLPVEEPRACDGILYLHGYGTTQSAVATRLESIEIVDRLARAGIPIVSMGSADDWGNNVGLDEYVEGYDYLAARYDLNHIGLLGVSMGSISSMLLLTQQLSRFIPVDVACLISPVLNLQAIKDRQAEGGVPGSLADSVDTAYNIPGGGTYAAQTAGHDPCLLPASVFRNKFIRIYASYEDLLIPRTKHTDVLRALAETSAKEFSVVTASGDHGHRSQYDPLDVVDWFKRTLPKARSTADPGWSK